MPAPSADEAAPSIVSVPNPPALAVSPSLSSFQVAPTAYLSAHSEYGGVATGALVFNPNTGKLLLLQRASHDSMPDRWEVPGGACDASDDTILAGLARELWEEASLVATAILVQVGGESHFHTRRGKRICKYSFLVATEAWDVKVDPEEHQAFVWASEEEARAKRVGEVSLAYTTPAQEQTIYEAFGAWKERMGKQ